MIELYGARTGNCLRVSIALEEAGLAYQVHRIDLRSGEHMGETYRALNPDGKVPTMIDAPDGGPRLVMSQSNAILMYLAERAPGRLLPIEGAERALAQQRFFFVLTDVIGPSHAAFHLRRAGEVAGPDVLQRMSARTLEKAEALLEGALFLSGESFGLADIAAVTTLPTLLGEADLHRLPNLSTWYQRTILRSSVRAGVQAFDPAPG